MWYDNSSVLHPVFPRDTPSTPLFSVERKTVSPAGLIGILTTVPENRCPYFSLSVGEVPLPGHSHPLRVPICRCALTEILTQRLRVTTEGRTLASLLESTPLDGQPRPVIGSDLEPISQQTCTAERLQARCLHGFQDILADFGADTTLPDLQQTR